MFHWLSYLIMLSLFIVVLSLKSNTARRWIGYLQHMLYQWYYLDLPGEFFQIPDLAGRQYQRKLFKMVSTKTDLWWNVSFMPLKIWKRLQVDPAWLQEERGSFRILLVGFCLISRFFRVWHSQGILSSLKSPLARGRIKQDGGLMERTLVKISGSSNSESYSSRVGKRRDIKGYEEVEGPGWNYWFLGYLVIW